MLGLLTFMAAWNDFLWPLRRARRRTTRRSRSPCRQLASGYYTDYSLVFAGTLLATLPLLLVFVLFGRQIIGGIMEGAVKA